MEALDKPIKSDHEIMTEDSTLTNHRKDRVIIAKNSEVLSSFNS